MHRAVGRTAHNAPPPQPRRGDKLKPGRKSWVKSSVAAPDFGRFVSGYAFRHTAKPTPPWKSGAFSAAIKATHIQSLTISTLPDTPPISDSCSSNPETIANFSLPQTPPPAANTKRLLVLRAPRAPPAHQSPPRYKFSSLRLAWSTPAAHHILPRSASLSPSPALAITARPASPTPQSHTSRYRPRAAPTRIPSTAPSPKTPPATSPRSSSDSFPFSLPRPHPRPPQKSTAQTPAPSRRTVSPRISPPTSSPTPHSQNHPPPPYTLLPPHAASAASPRHTKFFPNTSNIPRESIEVQVIPPIISISFPQPLRRLCGAGAPARCL